MSNSPNLQMPYLSVNQSQKEVVHNEALNILDALAQLNVLSRSTTTPPTSPSNGDCYIVPSSSTGVWASYIGYIAFYYDGWFYLTPKEGWHTWVADEDLFIIYTGSSWKTYNALGNDNVVNETADATLTALQEGYFFTNYGATAAVALTLPTPPTTFRSLEYTFYIAAAYTLTINCTSGTTIRNNTDVSSAAGSFSASTVGRKLSKTHQFHYMGSYFHCRRLGCSLRRIT